MLLRHGVRLAEAAALGNPVSRPVTTFAIASSPTVSTLSDKSWRCELGLVKSFEMGHVSPVNARPVAHVTGPSLSLLSQRIWHNR